MCAKFHCYTTNFNHFMMGVPPKHPPAWQCLKKPGLNRVKQVLDNLASMIMDSDIDMSRKLSTTLLLKKNYVPDY